MYIIINQYKALNQIRYKKSKINLGSNKTEPIYSWLNCIRLIN